MRIHFIAIGGAAMHNLAIALKQKNYNITGSDDEIFDPSLTRLKKAELLPEKYGWYPEKISKSIDVIILGMHAREDNPELMRAKELKLKIYSYPEFLYEQTKNKKRVVIGGSHGKTTITSMVMHVLSKVKVDFDYMVGAQIEGFDTMVSLKEDTKLAVFEGDEYLSSPIDRRPKFHLYKPHIALLSGIGWDHINVFPTFENYLDQFRIFVDKIEESGSLIYYKADENIRKILKESKRDGLKRIPYTQPPNKISDGKTSLIIKNNKEVPLEIFGDHNMQNLMGAKKVCDAIGILEDDFYLAIRTFKGSAKRLQKLYSDNTKSVFLDFAHSPSKVLGTIESVKKQFPSSEIIVAFELHTFSSLSKQFLSQYAGTLDGVDKAIVFYNPDVVKHKKLEPISAKDIIKGFKNEMIKVLSNTENLISTLQNSGKESSQTYIYMSSGNFGGLSEDKMVSIVTD